MACPNESQLLPMIRATAARFGIDPTIGIAQLRQESVNFQARYVCGPNKSPAGAQGLAQFMPGTAARFGLKNPFDPPQALEAWGKYMRLLLDMFGGRYDLALAGYNWGENRATLRNALRDGKSVLSYSIPAETRGYVSKILGSGSTLPPNVAVVPGGQVGAAPLPPVASGRSGVTVPVSGVDQMSWGPLIVGVAAVALVGVLLD